MSVASNYIVIELFFVDWVVPQATALWRVLRRCALRSCFAPVLCVVCRFCRERFVLKLLCVSILIEQLRRKYTGRLKHFNRVLRPAAQPSATLAQEPNFNGGAADRPLPAKTEQAHGTTCGTSQTSASMQLCWHTSHSVS